jgi:hypothetical protein
MGVVAALSPCRGAGSRALDDRDEADVVSSAVSLCGSWDVLGQMEWREMTFIPVVSHTKLEARNHLGVPGIERVNVRPQKPSSP